MTHQGKYEWNKPQYPSVHHQRGPTSPFSVQLFSVTASLCLSLARIFSLQSHPKPTVAPGPRSKNDPTRRISSLLQLLFSIPACFRSQKRKPNHRKVFPKRKISSNFK